MKGVVINGQSPKVLCLHSSMSNSRQWWPLMSALEDKIDSIAFDFYGYGDAPQVPRSIEYNLGVEVERIIQSLDDLGMSQPLMIVGHSMGGAVGLKLAYEYPDRFSSLALFEPVAFHLLEEANSGRQEIVEVATKVLELSDEHSAKTFVDYWNFDGFFDGLPEQTRTRFTQEVMKVRLEFSGLIGENHRLKDYKNIRQPTLLLSGAQSRLSAHSVISALSDTLPNVEIETVSGGHMAPITNVQQVNQALMAFIQKKQ